MTIFFDALLLGFHPVLPSLFVSCLSRKNLKSYQHQETKESPCSKATKAIQRPPNNVFGWFTPTACAPGGPPSALLGLGLTCLGLFFLFLQGKPFQNNVFGGFASKNVRSSPSSAHLGLGLRFRPFSTFLQGKASKNLILGSTPKYALGEGKEGQIRALCPKDIP